MIIIPKRFSYWTKSVPAAVLQLIWGLRSKSISVKLSSLVNYFCFALLLISLSNWNVVMLWPLSPFLLDQKLFYKMILSTSWKLFATAALAEPLLLFQSTLGFNLRFDWSTFITLTCGNKWFSGGERVGGSAPCQPALSIPNFKTMSRSGSMQEQGKAFRTPGIIVIYQRHRLCWEKFFILLHEPMLCDQCSVGGGEGWRRW